jgi:predicted dehydrogenase
VRLRYGVIGAGVVAPLHLQAIAALDDVELVGISADDRELAMARAQGAGCPWFVDNRDLLALAPDVVVVCTPHPSHPLLAIEALEAGAHVLVEKPITVEAREADAMIDAAERAGRLLGVCFQQRFRPVIAAAHALIASGRLGELLRVSIVDPLYRPNSYYATAGWRGTWAREGGGVLMNQAPHTLTCSVTLPDRRPRCGACRGGAHSRWRPKTRRPRSSSTKAAPSAPSRCRP